MARRPVVRNSNPSARSSGRTSSRRAHDRERHGPGDPGQAGGGIRGRALWDVSGGAVGLIVVGVMGVAPCLSAHVAVVRADQHHGEDGRNVAGIGPAVARAVLDVRISHAEDNLRPIVELEGGLP